jgi:hypothetical protein
MSHNGHDALKNGKCDMEGIGLRRHTVGCWLPGNVVLWGQHCAYSRYKRATNARGVVGISPFGDLGMAHDMADAHADSLQDRHLHLHTDCHCLVHWYNGGMVYGGDDRHQGTWNMEHGWADAAVLHDHASDMLPQDNSPALRHYTPWRRGKERILPVLKGPDMGSPASSRFSNLNSQISNFYGALPHCPG